MSWFVFCDGLNLKSNLRASEMHGIQIQVKASHVNLFQVKQKRMKSSAV